MGDAHDDLRLGGNQGPMSPPSPCAASECSEPDELQGMALAPLHFKSRKRLSKQLSMCETPRDIAWEKRRRQILRQERRAKSPMPSQEYYPDDITDGDLDELKGCIDLGFGFNEEDGQRLTNTFPALDLYFAVNRQLTPGSGGSTPRSLKLSAPSLPQFGPSESMDSPRSDSDWKICNPGDDPQQVKTKLRHWALAVACSVRQSL
ncbi:hypothetical protein MLD38_038683 [Melastoma candidum]|uniref:Uncharacterized protein n=1 Tax=Melastoma candidum TaxID=119954 RepID=A0ACB9L0P6_9MYRT|nr:hypothetical protein MLD38_038683 [Melastoma candidum]